MMTARGEEEEVVGDDMTTVERALLEVFELLSEDDISDFLTTEGVTRDDMERIKQKRITMCDINIWDNTTEWLDTNLGLAHTTRQTPIRCLQSLNPPPTLTASFYITIAFKLTSPTRYLHHLNFIAIFHAKLQYFFTATKLTPLIKSNIHVFMNIFIRSIPLKELT